MPDSSLFIVTKNLIVLMSAFFLETPVEKIDENSLSKKLGLTIKRVRSKDPYSCSSCKFQTTSKFKLRKHKASEHERILPQCAQCGYSAQNIKELRKHVRDNAACKENPVNEEKGKNHIIQF